MMVFQAHKHPAQVLHEAKLKNLLCPLQPIKESFRDNWIQVYLRTSTTAQLTDDSCGVHVHCCSWEVARGREFISKCLL